MSMSVTAKDDYQIWEAGAFVTQGGATLKQCKLAFKTFGRLNADKSNVIVYPTWYSGQHYENEWLIGEGMALDPAKYFIIVPNMLGNGLSSSPSNTPEPYNAARFPNITPYDNVTLQHRLCTEVFGIAKIALVTGWSMGAGQTYHWGAMFPDMVERIAPFCGSAKCSRHNFVFLEGVKAALTGDPAFAGGWYKSPPTQGLRAMGRVYAGWGLSQDFYRLELDKSVLGFASLEDFLVGFWEGLFLPRDANNLLCMLWTWQHGDLAKNKEFGGDFPKALQAITANTLIMPCDKDLYFPPKDNEIEVQHMRAGGGNCSTNVKYVVIESPWGHFAGGPGLCKEDTKFVDAQIKDLLSK